MLEPTAPRPVVPHGQPVPGGAEAVPLGIEESARRLGGYRWIEMRLFETVGAWVAAVPELEVKRCLATQAHHHAWHAELWLERLPTVPGLDAAVRTTPPSDGVVAFFEAVREPLAPELTIEKLVGFHRVVLPRLVTTYAEHLRRTSAVSDGPVIRALRLALHDDLEDWQEGERLLQSLLDSPAAVRRAADHQARLEGLLVAAGGLAG